jgi:hypothetical protein
MPNDTYEYKLSDKIDVDKIYNFSMTGEALKDLLGVFNGTMNTRIRYNKARIYENKLIVMGACFTDEGEVIPLPHAICMPFKVTQ